MEKLIRTTRSLCPVCLSNLPARMMEREDGQIFLTRTCPEHGTFSVPVWRGKVDFHRWVQYAQPPAETDGLHCPGHCGICPEHRIGTCCILLEVTRRCNLPCRFCFADGGTQEADPSLQELKEAVLDIVRQCGQPLLQLSGGEPTLRDDLPELVRFAREAGISYVQLNTNGIRLAKDPAYARALKEAGLDIVFLQFDGTNDRIYEYLRGKPLLDIKTQAIEVCSDLQVGVTLVPTIVSGVNDQELGRLVRFACERVPGVRGIHFQPVSYFGRYTDAPTADGRYTLDQLMADLGDQAGIPVESFMPSRCDHPLCGFHANFLLTPDGGLKPLTSITRSARERGSARDNREYVARHWRRPAAEPGPAGNFSDEMDFDTFLYRLRHGSLTLSAMAFQDAGNLNVERLMRCSLHVYDHGAVRPFCANYLTPAAGRP